MEKIQRLLDIQRTAFTEAYEVIAGDLKLSEPDITAIKSRIHVLDNKVEDINLLSKQLIDFLLDKGESVESDLINEIKKSDDLNCRYNQLKFSFEELCVKNSSQSVCGSHLSHSSNCLKSKLKFPRIEFTKYGGDLKGWIPFWSQFKRIHDDQSIEAEDKFQYLLQATLPKSRALLNNLKAKTNLATLYDCLECQLQSLETLGVTSDKYASMLFPLVESCLPEDLLRVWQRSQNNSDFDSSSTSYKSTDLRLTKLMGFLKKEVEGEEKISLATSCFDTKSKKPEIRQHISVSTASELINCQKHLKCVFCKGDHKNEDCTEAKQINLIEKKKILSSTGCCHLCLKYGHIARRCRVRLYCLHCKQSHATLMCPKQSKNEAAVCSSIIKENVESLSNNTYQQIFLQTILDELNNGPHSRKVRCIIDTGSQRSYINKFVASEMKLQSLGKETLIHALFGGQSEVVTHSVYKIRLDSIDKKYACNFQVLDQPIICTNINSIPKGPWISELSNLGIEIFDIKDAPIDVLIGADIAGKLFTGKKYNLPSGLVAMETQLGWTLLGKVSNVYLNTSSISLNMITSLLCKNDQITHLWSLDILGISDPGDNKSKKELEMAVMQHFHDTVHVADGRYEVALPWIEGHPPIPTNFYLTKRRLDNLMVKLKNDGYYDEYNKVLSEWLAEGVIEVVPRGEEMKEAVHYLPHRHVVKLDNTTTKLRPVFDASAREKGSPSLNQCLEKGINLLDMIPTCLIRFRLFKIGVIADIRRAFLQIGILEADRDFLRFLWYDKDCNLTYFRHARVVFGVTCSPFHLNAVIQLHLNNILVDCLQSNSQYSFSVIDKLRKSFYVDNCVCSVDSEEELREFIDQSTKVMNEAKFDLRLWEYTVFNNVIPDTFVSNLLGLKWNRIEDTLEICFDWFKTSDLQTITKRTILSFVNKVFDPLGFLCPVLLLIKILLQKMWSLKIGWDVEVPLEIKNTFVDWIYNLSYLVNIKIPRYLSHPLLSTLEINSKSVHLFTDASQHSYAAVVFLRSEDNKGSCSIQLIQAKSRLAPIRNKMSIPRLELLAATIGARLLSSVLSVLEDKIPVYCWSDSSTVLAWIQRDDQWKPFVWNRVKEIQSLTKKEDWYFIPGQLNPADLPSRGCSSKQLLQSRWWEGPFWLLQEKEFWPSENYVANELKVGEEKSNRSSISCINVKHDFSWYYRYFSDYQKIVNLVGWILRFINNCRKENIPGRFLTINEIENAEKVILKLVQQESFTGIDDKSFSSLIPFKDKDGIFRLKTKISERDDLFDFRHPVILPSRHPVVFRLIYKCHVDNCHIGVQALLSHMREKFWILKGRRTIKSVVSKCTRCRRYDAKSFETVPVPLPENRVKDIAVFEIIGVDLAGPLFVKSMEKVWVCIFTCAVYRAVHLELVSSLSTDSFLQAFRKFISRRGRPSIVYSDNGTNFVGSENAFKRINFNKIVEYSTAQRICWKFSPPTAAWWGGWWERLIRLLKQLLRKTLGTTSLSFDELCTTLYECEAIMNSRPLTYVSDDAEDLIPLTPLMFLQEIKEIGVPDIDRVDKHSLNRHLQYRVKLKMDFKTRFRREYLGQLILRNKRCCPKEINIGDVVLISNEGIKRIEWPLAVVIETFRGNDGNIRVARLRTSLGFVTRPIKRLYPLEVHSEVERQNFRKELEQRKPDGNKVEINDELKPNIEDVGTRFSRYGRSIKAPERFQS